MNILTFDIEEWYIEKAFHGARQEKYAEYDRYLVDILNMLDERNLKATFFVVGKMATDFPEVVRRIDERGHEIGCHSNAHTWLNKMSHQEAMDDTRQAVNELEQCVGKKILSYRAPAFSIGEINKWAFEILAECGIKRDSSIFPAARDFGGFSSFGYKEPVLLTYSGIRLKEFPISTAKLFGTEIAYSGGGYFRFFPLWFVKKELKKAPYSMCYFHIGDLLPETSGVMSKKAYEEYFKESGTLMNRYKRYFKSNFGKKGAWIKLEKLIRTQDFISLEKSDEIIDWACSPQKVL